MFKHEVRSPEQALAYITDCNLATVSSMAMLKSRKKGEYERQISIAQHAVDWMQQFNVSPGNTRAKEVIEQHNGSVSDWVAKYDVHHLNPHLVKFII